MKNKYIYICLYCNKISKYKFIAWLHSRFAKCYLKHSILKNAVNKNYDLLTYSCASKLAALGFKTIKQK